MRWSESLRWYAARASTSSLCQLAGIRPGCGAFDDPARPASPARFVFLEPDSHGFFGVWRHAADDMVGLLRSEHGRSGSGSDAVLGRLADWAKTREDARLEDLAQFLDGV